MLRIVAGKYKGQKLSTPRGMDTRPTSSRLREAVFNICQNVVKDAKVLDIFAGSGAMGIEALSRGARIATFIDKDRRATQCIKNNLQLLKADGQVLAGEALAMLERLKHQSFDLIYIDPPYGVNAPNSEELYASAILQWIDSQGILSPHGMLFVEEAKNATLDKCVLERLQVLSKRSVGASTLWQFATGEPA